MDINIKLDIKTPYNEIDKLMKKNDGKEPMIDTQKAIEFTGIPAGTFMKKSINIPRCKIGKRYYYRKSDLSAWMLR
jgi:hypothetical protein